jgi:hypothetical protein
MKHNDQRLLLGHECIKLYGGDQNASAQVHVDAFYDAQTNVHVQPSETPHPATAILLWRPSLNLLLCHMGLLTMDIAWVKSRIKLSRA